MKKDSFSATSLRSLLLASVVLIAVAIIGGFYFAGVWLSDSAANSKTKNYTSVSGNLNSDQIVKRQEDVYNHKAVSAKAASFIASSQTFESSIRQDLTKYATDIGISITNFSLAQKPSVVTTDVPIAGVKTQFVSVTLGNPVEFTKLLEFIQAIETNVPKMKLTGISMDSSSGQSGSVSVKPIIIEVYTE